MTHLALQLLIQHLPFINLLLEPLYLILPALQLDGTVFAPELFLLYIMDCPFLHFQLGSCLLLLVLNQFVLPIQVCISLVTQLSRQNVIFSCVGSVLQVKLI